VRTRASRLAFALLAGAILVLPLDAGATVPGANGLIAYSDGTGIVVANADGSSPAQLTSTPGDADPSWNGEGTKIVFSRAGTIEILTVPKPPASGGAVTALGAGANPAFSPDGSKVAYQSGGEIFVTAADGSGTPTNVTNSAAVDEDPTWNADGSKLAFARQPPGGTFGIWTMNADGGGQTQVTSGIANDTRPSYSPSGDTIAFESDRDGAAQHQIYAVASGGGSPTRLTNTTSDERRPAFSPDGTLVYFARTGAGIFSIPSGGGSPTQVVTAASATAPDDQPQLKNVSPPTLSGGTNQGQTLTVTNGTWAPPYNVDTFHYQWQNCDQTNFCGPIGTDSPMYTTGADDVNRTIKVTVTASNGWGSASASSSSSIGPITAGPLPSNSVLPTISLPFGFDAPQIGLTLTATQGTWVGRTPMNFRYQWTKCDDKTKSCYDIPSATSSFFSPTADLAGWDISVTVYASNDWGLTYVRAVPTKPVTAAPPLNHGSPVITGQNYVKSQLTSTTGVWTGFFPITYTYQWKRCDAFGTLDSCLDIAGATNATYTLTTADLDKTLRVYVTATNAIKSVTQFSNHTFPTLPERHFAPTRSIAPTLTGTPKPGFLLRTTSGTWSGDTPFTFQYQWERCDATGAECLALPKANLNRYTLTAKDLGFTIRVKITAKNAYGTSVAESDPTDTVSHSPKPPKGRHIVGTARADYLGGSGGNDVIEGRGGNDTLSGGAGNDVVDGGAGNDVIDGGKGPDRISGDEGSDTIVAADGDKDIVDCGPGNDRVVADDDDVLKNCESISHAASTGSTAPPTATPRFPTPATPTTPGTTTTPSTPTTPGTTPTPAIPVYTPPPPTGT
jgi:hypothetical protein